MKSFCIVVAADQKFGIGKDGQMPWHLPADLKHFKEITTSQTSSGKSPNAVVMGRKTWEALPDKFRPLKNRINIVISHNKNLPVPKGVFLSDSLDQALGLAEKKCNTQGAIFVIGGAQIFKQAIQHPACEKIYMTHVLGDYHCDTFFPDNFSAFKKIKEKFFKKQGNIGYFFAEYVHF